jgi:hypothetical protein
MTISTTLRKLIASLTVALFILASCATVGNRVISTGKPKSLTENGVVLLNFDRGITTGDNAFELLISPINPSTGMIHAATPEGIYTAARAIAGVTNPNWPQDKYWALTLVPGEYAISSIRQLPKQRPNSSYSSSAFSNTPMPSGAGIAAVVILGAALVVLGGMAIAEAVKENDRTDEDRIKNPKGAVLFIDADSEKRPTPRFHVEAGKVTYIGDILIDLEDRIVDAVNDNDQGDAANKSDDPPRKMVEKRTFVVYGSDLAEAKNYAQKVGLAAAPLTAVHLSALADQEVNLLVIRSGDDIEEPSAAVSVEKDSKKVPAEVQNQQPAKVTATPKPQAPATKSADRMDVKSAPTKPGAPATKTAGKMNLKQLMKAFLAGEITKQEYDDRREALK